MLNRNSSTAKTVTEGKRNLQKRVLPEALEDNQTFDCCDSVCEQQGPHLTGLYICQGAALIPHSQPEELPTQTGILGAETFEMTE